jgi:predicted amino acid-binding ACT domain protein
MMRKDESLFDWVVVSVISQDRPGIVASVSKALYENHYNIEALSQTAVLGQFAMILVASAKKGQPHRRLETAFQTLSQTMGFNITLKEAHREDPTVVLLHSCLLIPFFKNIGTDFREPAMRWVPQLEQGEESGLPLFPRFL